MRGLQRDPVRPWLRLPLPLLACVLVAGAVLLPSRLVEAQRVADVRGTRHNLSTSGPGGTHAAPGAPGSTSEVCVFCHTPHGASQADQGGSLLRSPLWNRRVPAGTTYTPYTSQTLDAQNIVDGLNSQPGGSSKLCLSCHDGTLAIGNVNVLGGATGVSIPMQGTGPGGTMPAGEGTGTGYTRNLGVDLRNDHPISVTYNAALALRDGELRTPDAQQRWPAGSGSVLGLRAPGQRPLLPLEPTGAGAPGNTGQVQCATCHDPHVRELDASKGNQKFLRAPRFQEAAPSATHSAATDIICLSCHDKNGSFGTWAHSAHARPDVADETYKAAAAALREFPAGLPVWKAACLNCHDTHTVPGARRLTREGTDGALPGGNPLAARQGGNPALENTCFQCHTTAARSALASVTGVPDLETPFGMAIRMPITSADQGVAREVHDPSAGFNEGTLDCSGPTNRCGADGLEPRSTLFQRHAECTDCHNPHRVIRNRLFNGNPAVPDAAGTHRHDETTGYTHTNLASGVLRGAWGVEPQYASTSFHSLPSGYAVKRGDPGSSTGTAASEPYVTREYQICLKCHSDYGYPDNNVYPVGNRPPLGRSGGTAPGTNNLTQYTNQAKEFQAPVSHQGEGTRPGSGAGSGYATNNHRSWHPVIGPTGRSGMGANALRAPWGNAIGTQTMYCSDCHGENTGPATVVPNGGEQGAAWGPHGSSNAFLLKGAWNSGVGADNRGDNGPTANGLCFKCHQPDTDATRNGSGTTGFFNGSRGNLHAYHTDKIGRMRCTWCHVAVPHGWKNKALLVNLNDVGEEAGQPAGGNREFRFNTSGQAYNQEPYYLNAKLKVRTFATSGNWVDTNCGSNNSAQTFGINGNNTQNGKNWMQDVCSNPP